MVNFCMQVRDRFRLTKQALESLATAGMTDMTVTVLDDRSKPETRDYVMTWCNMFNAHYVRNNEPLGTGQLRNTVIRESEKHFGRGDYLAPHDNDTFFTDNWLKRMVQFYQLVEPCDFRLLTGAGHPYHLPIFRYAMPGTDFDILAVQAVPTQSTFMTWKTWDRYGPYCDTPVDKTCQSEDVFLTNKIRADGYKLGEVYPHLVHATALKNTFGEPGPGWELVKAQCPEGIICE